MKDFYSRTAMVLGEEAVETLKTKRVAVFGIGGVGGHCAEALVRAGIGEIDLIDHDTVVESNLNRQLFAVRSQLGRLKVDAAEERLLDINEELIVHKHPVFYLPDQKGDIILSDYDYVIDCIDTVSAKIDIITDAIRQKIPVISAMGCGNRIDPSRLAITDLFQTKNDPLARVMRHELRKRNITKLDVICSSETPVHITGTNEEEPKKRYPGSTAFVPSAAGIMLASYTVRRMLGL